MDNVYVKMVIMIIIKLIYVNHALHFGNIQLLIISLLLIILFSIVCTYNDNDDKVLCS